MLAPPGEILRAGIEQRLNRVKRATQSYLRDRTRQATGTATSYAVASGLYAAAGIFLLATCLVGLMALFRWVEIHYGQFVAFGVIGGLLVLLALVCAGVAAARLKRPAPHFPSLASRLRVAIASPLVRTPAEESDPAVDPDSIPLAPRATARPLRGSGRQNTIGVPVGLAVTALLLGWAATRRRRNSGGDDGVATR
jgi:hypothetical protein